MKLDYQNIKDESKFTLTNFTCTPSLHLLNRKGLYKILWAKTDDAEITIDGYHMTIKKNQVVFCTPLNVVELDKDAGFEALVFNREFYCIRDHDDEVSCYGFLFFGSAQPKIATLKGEDITRFEASFYMIKDEFKTKDNIQGEMLRVLLKRLLITSTRLLKSESETTEQDEPQYDLVRQFHVLVEQHFREKHAVADYADLLFKSPKTLSNVFKKSGNTSPLKVINSRLALEAKRLLLYSDKTAEEVAFEIGFNDPAHFSRFFKKEVGVPPSKFGLES
ncbi:helix-turn-helix domain-containing protein [Winogradskyella maritima]|uniref:Helix-turn-helix domain-containing protein n=1 Tax=Winogradskyella maritima TaxID=1517766 RepID=A0ABV8AED9_9FLAO|nr:helix-turn-helix domain-containing protein [Winogradskyella maritima]